MCVYNYTHRTKFCIMSSLHLSKKKKRTKEAFFPLTEKTIKSRERTKEDWLD